MQQASRTVYLGLALLVTFWGTALRAAAPTAAPAKPQTPVDVAVQTLLDEAADRFSQNATKLITIRRPHPAVAKLDYHHVNEILRAMAGKLTGDPMQDVYIRYHLMDVVNRSLDTTPEPFTQALMNLAPMIPDDTEIELKPWYSYDPPAIGQRYRMLIDSCAVSVGFPPFRRTVWAPESFQYMDAKNRPKLEANYAEALTLVGKFKTIDNPANHVSNWRSIWMNWVVRQYRGEVLYALVAQGDRKAFDKIVDAVVNAAANNPMRATDFASFLNAAYFNGLIGDYDPAVLKSAAAKLRQAAVASERAAHAAAVKAQPIKNGKTSPTMSVGWFDGGGRWRQVPESLFTIVFGIENNRVPKKIAATDRNRPTTKPVAPATTQPIKADDLTLPMIDAAIARGVTALEQLRPPDVDLNFTSYASLGLPNNYWHQDFTMPGQGALSAWAMLTSGEIYHSPWMKRRMGWVLCYDSPNTYDRAMRLQLLSMLGYPDLQPWIKRDAQWLMDTMTEQGNWEARNTGQRSAGYGDNANGQYAMLGLWAAAQAGVEVPEALWMRVDNYWRQAQRPPNAPGEGAWAVTSSAALQKGANLNAFANQVSASMTAGGVLSMYLTEMYLYGGKRVEVGQSLSPELLRGVRWLDENFSMEKLDGDSDFYFYMWTIQNVGQATGYRTFNNVDWFREGAARLINTQAASGLWTGPKGPHVSTSFALACLARARGPLAICKVRFEPTPPGKTAAIKAPAKSKDPRLASAWNNRPNDMYNFVTDTSRRLEVPTSWQIADLDQPLYELAEATLLYLATDKPFKLAPEEFTRLKEYIDAGGTLVCVPEGKNNLVALNSMKALANDLNPGLEPIRCADNKHLYYTLAAKVKGIIPTIRYETAVRPRVVIVEKDISRDLQANKPTERDAFSLLNNIYLYASGLDAKRPRIVSSHLKQKVAKPKYALAAARVKVNGNYDPEPLALPQLKAFVGNQHNIDLDINTVGPTDLTSSTKIAFLTVGPGTSLDENQAGALKRWIVTGGTLWIDAAAGSAGAMEKLDEVIEKIGLEEQYKTLDKTTILTGEDLQNGYFIGSGSYRAFRGERGEKAQLKAKFVNGRPALLVCRGDLTSGLAGLNHWNIVGMSVAGARQVVANSLLTFLPPPPKPKPATQPSTRPTTGPSTNPSTRPATRPAAAPAALPSTAAPAGLPATAPSVATTQPATAPSGALP